VLRLLLLRHGPTPTTASAAFGDDGELTQRGRQQAAALELPRVHRVLRSPALIAASTAQALELDEDAELDSRLADWDPGAWRGRTLDDLAQTEPDGIAAWLGDPGATPHGGEALDGVLARAAAWLEWVAGLDDTVLAITHAAIVRAAVLSVLQAPPSAFWALDVAPLALTELRHRDGRWHLRGLNR
jgi:broad specificity phosphatase PhoE